jgi:hypothetical protein
MRHFQGYAQLFASQEKKKKKISCPELRQRKKTKSTVSRENK